MRYCDAEGGLLFDYDGPLLNAPPGYWPWFDLPGRKPISADLVFGHWAALEGWCSAPRTYAIDTGCVWGRDLTALRLQDKQRFAVPG